MTAKDVLSDAITAWDQAANAEKSEAPPPPPPEAPAEPAPEPVHNLPAAMQQFQQPVPTLRLCAVRIQGLRNVRPGFLASLCKPYVDGTSGETKLGQAWYGGRTEFAPPGEPTTFRTLLEATTALSSDLSRLDMVRDIAARLEPSRLSTGNPEEDVDIVLQVKPSKRFFLKTNTSVGQSEGTASVQGKVRNVFGGAETLEGSATLGTRTRYAYNAVLSTPVMASPDVWASISALSQHRDMSSYISAHEGQHALRAALMVMRGDGVRRELAYEATHRHFHHLLPEASVAIRRLAQPSIKSALTYTMEHDTRDDAFMTTTGSHTRAVLEYAGLGGDTSFVKADGYASIARAFGQGWAWSLGARGGLLHTLDGRPACLSDRFMLGGPTDVRMFRLNSLGPRQKYDSLGGDAYWALGASLLAPIPARADWPLKFHLFLNAGQLAQVQQGKRFVPTSYSELLQPSASTGIGLLFQQGPVRLELNFGLPLLARRSDGTRKGLQFGIGLEFL